MSVITEITSNGGGGTLPIEALFDRLASDPLDRTFEEFIFADEHEPSLTRFFGNFYVYSHVFNLRTDDPALVRRLTAAIHANQLRPDYLNQQTWSEIKAEQWAAEKARRDARIKKEKGKARAVLGVKESVNV